MSKSFPSFDFFDLCLVILLAASIRSIKYLKTPKAEAIEGVVGSDFLPVTVESVGKSDHLTLIEIWESSVRDTHDFLSEDDIAALKPLIFEQYFDAVDLRCAKSADGHILGFCGVAEGNIEMLFVAPEARGKGAGTLLCGYAIQNQRATKVDVNEQNPQAIGFYQYMGFSIVGRSEVDGQGRPFPLLHMVLQRV